MGFQDRQYGDDSGDGGRLRRLFGRIFENADNPLGWSIRMFRALGIDARIHLLTVAFLVGTLLFAIPKTESGFFVMLPMMVWLFVVVLLHEFGHCLACRRVGGHADRIVMLPWGGLALATPPNEWRAHFWTTAGGPLVNVALLPVTVGLLLLLGEGETIVFDPFRPSSALLDIEAPGAAALYYVKVAAWTLHFVNIVILAFNVLLPFFPMDGGRLLQALLWRKIGYRRATEIAVVTGFVGAGVLALVGIWTRLVMLVLIAVMGFWACYTERQRIRADAELAEMGLGGQSMGLGVSLGPNAAPDEPEERGPSRAERKRAEREAAEAAELDALLAKVGRGGLDGLTRAERRRLDRLGEKKRRG